MQKSIVIVAMWLGPAFACWATEEPFVALAFIASAVATLWVSESPYP